MIHTFYDAFVAGFSKEKSVLLRGERPLGAFAVEYLNLDKKRITELRDAVRYFEEDRLAFLTAYNPSSAGSADESLKKLWAMLSDLPVFDQLGVPRDRIPSHFSLLYDSDLRLRMLDAKSSEGRAEQNRRAICLDLPDSIDRFVQRIEEFLENYFQDLPGRNSSVYAERYKDYRNDVHEELLSVGEQADAIIECGDMSSDEEETAEQLHAQLEEDLLFELRKGRMPGTFHVEIGYSTYLDPQTNKRVFLERFAFDKLEDFLYLDLIKGLEAGHYPRVCQHCGRFFLLTSGYDIRYCENIAPGETTKTCKQIGAHQKEKRENEQPIRKEYQRTYTRIKARKQRDTIDRDQWNDLVKKAMEIRDEGLSGKITTEECIRRLREL